MKAVNSSVVQDSEVLVGGRVQSPLQLDGAREGDFGTDGESEVGTSVRSLLGRGPGRVKDVLVGVGR